MMNKRRRSFLFDLDCWVQVDSVKKPIKRNSEGSGHTSHYWTSPIHPDTMRSVRPLAKRVCGRCHNQQLLSSDQCAPHHSWREALPSLGAQRRRLAPSRNRHNAVGRVVKAAGDGSRDASDPKTRCWAQAVLLAPHENPHFVPGAHRFMDFASVPSVLCSS